MNSIKTESAQKKENHSKQALEKKLNCSEYHNFACLVKSREKQETKPQAQQNVSFISTSQTPETECLNPFTKSTRKQLFGI